MCGLHCILPGLQLPSRSPCPCPSPTVPLVSWTPPLSHPVSSSPYQFVLFSFLSPRGPLHMPLLLPQTAFLLLFTISSLRSSSTSVFQRCFPVLPNQVRPHKRALIVPCSPPLGHSLKWLLTLLCGVPLGSLTPQLHCRLRLGGDQACLLTIISLALSVGPGP